MCPKCNLMFARFEPRRCLLNVSERCSNAGRDSADSTSPPATEIPPNPECHIHAEPECARRSHLGAHLGRIGRELRPMWREHLFPCIPRTTMSPRQPAPQAQSIHVVSWRRWLSGCHQDPGDDYNNIQTSHPAHTRL